MLSPGITYHVCESKTFSTGGKVVVSLTDLPKGARIKGFLLRLNALFTQSSASAIAGDVLRRIFESIVIGKRIRTSGQLQKCLNWMQLGRNWGYSAGVPSTNGAYRRIVQTYVGYEDLGAAHPSDAQPNTEFFRDTPIEVTFGNVTSLFGSGTTLTGTLRVVALIEPASPGVIPSDMKVDYQDWNQQDVFLGPGKYTHLFLYNENGDNITSAEVTDVSMWVDGHAMYSDVRADELVAGYNLFNAEGTSLETASETVPVGGEELVDEQAVTDAAADTISMDFVPVVVPGRHGYLLSKCLTVERGMRLQFSGTDTSLRLGYRMIEASSAASIVKAAAKLGLPAPTPATEVIAKGHKGSPVVQPALFPYLPKRLVSPV